jgi:UDP-N-acetylmuramyl pentapeptide phosphotransferase/UDP-N-acetylglucosamine-1-phosphate transferase
VDSIEHGKGKIFKYTRQIRRMNAIEPLSIFVQSLIGMIVAFLVWKMIKKKKGIRESPTVQKKEGIPTMIKIGLIVTIPFIFLWFFINITYGILFLLLLIIFIFVFLPRYKSLQ